MADPQQQHNPNAPTLTHYDQPPLYENWLPNDEYNRAPYGNPLTVGLITSAPVQETRHQAHTIVIMPVVLGRRSARMNCPHCLADVSTAVRNEPGIIAYVSCLIMFLFGFWCCCCIPFCMDSCQVTEHSCPNCNKIIGRRD